MTMTDRALSAIILAAGAGTRMRSSRPKPIHLLAGRSLLHYMIDSLADCAVGQVALVVGHGADQVTDKLRTTPVDLDLRIVEQIRRDGTGDATAVGLTGLDEDLDDDDVLVLPGDMPLLRPSTIAELVRHHREADAAATVLSAVLEDATGYGRVIRDRDGAVARIVEQADADADEDTVREVNTAVYCFRRSLLAPALRRITPQNVQGEYYLTDVVAVLREAGHRVEAVVVDDPSEAEGINDRVQLAAAEAELRRRTNLGWMQEGVTLVDPANTYIDSTVRLGNDVTVFPGAVLQGDTVIGAGSEIGPACRIVNSRIGTGVRIERSDLRDATVGDDCHVGPFAAIGPDATLASGSVTGAFYAEGRTGEERPPKG